MTEDVFAIKELREIILSFPQSNGSSANKASSLLNASSGDSLWLSDHVRKRILRELSQADRRIVLSSFAERLDIGSKDLLSLLGEPEARPQWCYTSGIHTIVPVLELSRLLDELCDTCSTRFVVFHEFCQAHDLNATDFRDQLRRINVSSHDSQMLGIGKWYDHKGQVSKSVEYVYRASLLDSTRSLVRNRMQQAMDHRQPESFTVDDFHGLDPLSFQCLAHKVLEVLLDFNSDWIQKCSLLRESADEVKFIPLTAGTAEKERRIEEFLERSNSWRTSSSPDMESMPCLALTSAADFSQDSETETFRKFSEALAAMHSAERLVRFGAYTVVYRCIRTLADQLLAGIETSASVLMTPPEDVAPRDAKAFLARLYDCILTDFSTDENLVIRIGNHIALKSSMDRVQQIIAAIVEDEARSAWEAHAKDPSSSALPSDLSDEKLLRAIRANAPDADADFYEAVLKEDLSRSEGRKPTQRSTYDKLWSTTLSNLEGAHEARFVEAFSKHVLARLQLHILAVEALEAGKLRTDLATLLRDYLLASFLADAIRQAKDDDGFTVCGKRVERVVGKLRTQLTEHTPSTDHAKQEADLTTVASLYTSCGNKLKSTAPTAAQLADVKDGIRNETLANARSARADKDGSRAFLCVILILWAQHNEGFAYATGRSVPRLLKLLKGKVDDSMYTRLQELKDVVKGGQMTREQRDELISFAGSSITSDGNV